VGGWAVSARAEPRFTRDVDVAVVVRDDADAEDLASRLKARGYEITALVEQDQAGRLATLRLIAPGEPAEGIVVDLLFASSGIEDEIVRAATPIGLAPDLEMLVARTGHLVALKVLSRDDRRRPQDVADIRALITERGFQRGRDLTAALDAALAMRDD
jgi:hypothetical protein